MEKCEEGGEKEGGGCWGEGWMEDIGSEGGILMGALLRTFRTWAMINSTLGMYSSSPQRRSLNRIAINLDKTCPLTE